MMEPTIVQNGALYEAQHRYIKPERKHLRLWRVRPTGVDEFGQNSAIIGARAADWLEPWSSYRPATS